MHPILAALWRFVGIWIVCFIAYMIYEKFLWYKPERDDPVLRKRQENRSQNHD